MTLFIKYLTEVSKLLKYKKVLLKFLKNSESFYNYFLFLKNIIILNIKMGKTDQNIKVTSANFERKSKYDKDFKFVKKTNDSRYGDIKVLEDPKTNEKFLLKEKVLNSEDHAKKIYSTLYD